MPSPALHLRQACWAFFLFILPQSTSSAFLLLPGVPVRPSTTATTTTSSPRLTASSRPSNLLPSTTTTTTTTTATALFSSPNSEQQQSLKPRVELPLPPGYNRVEISYCIGCRWMLRAAWLAQELLTTFQEEIQEVAIQPVKDPAGTFEIRLNNQLLFARKAAGRFPEAKEVKQLIRDVINPDRDLGHSDVGGKNS